MARSGHVYDEDAADFNGSRTDGVRRSETSGARCCHQAPARHDDRRNVASDADVALALQVITKQTVQPT
jgi:hypothetical protein